MNGKLSGLFKIIKFSECKYNIAKKLRNLLEYRITFSDKSAGLSRRRIYSKKYQVVKIVEHCLSIFKKKQCGTSSFVLSEKMLSSVTCNRLLSLVMRVIFNTVVDVNRELSFPSGYIEERFIK